MKIHLIAICGTAMGTLAGLLKKAGHEVRGSDQDVYPPMSDQLVALGIPIARGYLAANLDWGPDLVVIGNAVTRDNPEAQAVMERGLGYTSQAEALYRFFLRDRHPVVIAGTHGKSTTTSLMAWVLESAGRDPGLFVGAVQRNFGRSFKIGKGDPFVVEGDEYDTAFFDKGPKFLHYAPKTAILTSIEFDHADIYKDLDAIRAAFREFIVLVPEEGTLVACFDDPIVREEAAACRGRVLGYALKFEQAEWKGTLLESGPKGSLVEISRGGKLWARVQSPMWGRHNLANQVAVAAASATLGLTGAEWAAGIERFLGVRRRQEVRGVSPRGVTVIDDFAHHPTAVRVTLEALKPAFSEGRLWAVFEPRTNTTRRAIFQQAYAQAFDAADEVVIAGVDKPEKAPEGDRFEPEQLVADLKGRGIRATYIKDVPDIVAHIGSKARRGDAVAVLSNGGFGGIHGKLLEALD